MTNNQDTGYINQAGQNYFDSFIFYFLKIGICLFLVSWYLVIQAPLAHAGAIIGRPLYLGLEQGLVGFWSFDGQDMTGNTAFDRSGQGNNGTLTNGPRRVAGRIGQALEFDGDDDLISIPLSSSHDNLRPVTYSFWIYAHTYSLTFLPVGQVYSKGGGPTRSVAINNDIETDSLEFYHEFSGASALSALAEAGSITLNEWNHIAVTWTGGNSRTSVTFYINGVLTPRSGAGSDGDGTPSDDSGGEADMGGGSQSFPFDGAIDDVRVYNRALSPDEIRRLYRIGSTLTVGESKSTGTLQEGLVGFWSFDGPDMAGVTAFDRSGQGNNGTLTNGPRRIAGRIGQALEFDGNNDTVTTGDINLLDNVAIFSISFWLKSHVAVSPIDAKPVSQSGILSIEQQESNQNVKCQVTGSDVTDYGAFYIDGITDTSWHHVVCVKDGSTVRVFVDTVVGGTVPSMTVNTNTNSNAFHISDDVNGGNAFNGLIDDVRIYNRALSPDEIRRLYRIGSTLTVGESKSTGTLQEGLVGFWSFDGPDMAGVTAFDRSGQGNNGTLTNGPRRIAGRIGQALEFDGADDRLELGAPASLDSLLAKTIAAWIHPDSFFDGGYLYVFSSSGASDQFALRLCSDVGSDCSGMSSTFAFSNQDTNADPNSWVAPAGTILLNHWQHVAVTYVCGSTDAFLFLNGRQVATTKTETALANCNPATGVNKYIAYTEAGAGDPFDGTIDDVRIYNRALSPDEIRRLYQMGR